MPRSENISQAFCGISVFAEIVLETSWTNSVDLDQTASILPSVNIDRQPLAADSLCRGHFQMYYIVGTLRVNMTFFCTCMC